MADHPDAEDAVLRLEAEVRRRAQEGRRVEDQSRDARPGHQDAGQSQDVRREPRSEPSGSDAWACGLQGSREPQPERQDAADNRRGHQDAGRSDVHAG